MGRSPWITAERKNKEIMPKQRIDAFIEGAKEEMIRDIIQLVSFASINGNKEENRACLRCFLQRAEEIGFRTMTTSQLDVGIVEMGQGDEILGILVHLDVVGIGDRQKWTNHPFEGTHRDGFLWGRGTEDDKGAAIMSLYAMKSVAAAGLANALSGMADCGDQRRRGMD